MDRGVSAKNIGEVRWRNTVPSFQDEGRRERTGRLIRFGDEAPSIVSSATVVGKKEGEGPLGRYFDICDKSDGMGCETFEQAESELQRQALNLAMAKRGIYPEDVEAVFAGDLLNQCTASSYGVGEFGIPYFGLYGACSTVVEGLMLASITVDRGVYSRVAAVVSSHNGAAERQFRFPLEYGSQRPPTAQWTVTGAGAFLVEKSKNESCENCTEKLPSDIKTPRITAAMPGRIVDMGINDANNMGAAMAPAAADTLSAYFRESGEDPAAFDYILTGDLGFEGNSICRDLLRESGIKLGGNFTDCGMLIFDPETQDTHSGGSGCGCSATVFGGFIMERFRRGEISRVLLVGTGALMSPSMIQQGKSIAGIGHLIEVRSKK